MFIYHWYVHVHVSSTDVIHLMIKVAATVVEGQSQGSPIGSQDT